MGDGTGSGNVCSWATLTIPSSINLGTVTTCGCTQTRTQCEALCDSIPGCMGVSFASRMNVVPGNFGSTSGCGAGGAPVYPLGSYGWCSFKGASLGNCHNSYDIFDEYMATTPSASSLSASSPPPPPPGSTHVYVSATVILGGYTLTTFGSAQAPLFESVIATTAGVPANAVIITSVTTSYPSGRHLSDASVLVAFSVATTSTSASSISIDLTFITGSGAVSAFQTAGLSACTSVAISTPPSTGTSTPVDATSQLPVTTSSLCNTLACAGCTSCAAAQTCANTYSCTGNQHVTNFQCTTVNGVGSWSASCASSASSTIKPMLGLAIAVLGAHI